MKTRIEDAPDWLTFKAVQQIIGKGQRTVSRLLKDGRLDKIGRGRASRISLKSVLAYLEQEREIAEVARTVPNTSMQKAAAWARKKQQEDRLRRAVQIVNEGGAPVSTTNPTGDPRLEACVFEGVCISVAERDEILDRRWRAQTARRYVWSNVLGV